MALDALSAIERRTSVRRFRPDPVPREIVEQLLELAVRAPNHKLTEPWRFAVLTGTAKARLADLQAEYRRQKYADPTSPDAQAAADKKRRDTLETPIVIAAMCAVSTEPVRREDDYAATMMALANLMIAAQALGLGTYLRTGELMHHPGVTALVGLPDGCRIVGLVSLGYPAEEDTPRRRRPAAELTTWIDA